MTLFPLYRFVIQGKSMLPKFKPGDSVISFNWAYLFSEPKVGDVVVINFKGKPMIKRTHKVYDRTLYVLGDNPSQSTDSRSFGPIKTPQIIGKVVFTLRP